MKFLAIAAAAVSLVAAHDDGGCGGGYGGGYSGYNGGWNGVHYDSLERGGNGPALPFPHNFAERFYDTFPRCGVRSRTYATGYVPKLTPKTYSREVQYEPMPCGAPLKFLPNPEATIHASLVEAGKDFFTRGGMASQLSTAPVTVKPFCHRS